MKKYTLAVGVCAMILAVTYAAVAQQDNAARQQAFQRMRQTQQKAMADLEAGIAKLKALQEPAQRTQNREQFQNMSQEERTRLRESFTQRREQQTAAMQAVQNSIIILDGGRQIRTEQRELMAALRAIKDLAVEENATKTAEAVQKLMDEKQKAYEEKLTALGLDPNMRTFVGQTGPRGQGGQGGQRRQRPQQ
ncbi:MAG TPA: hypothetical protein P5279_14210 [Anaerohalosphaeraceae bacterium]|jgi:hypothetical protein|nr:hypothetical protein [Anaerohalosphaeraceae bacterium]HRT51641.1 hypothetical protein [Anaerohalosphaeraceae bacterium]HRT87350.1 hypothetical protein [Anaerohalosphaeraceae bacterium]